MDIKKILEHFKDFRYALILLKEEEIKEIDFKKKVRGLCKGLIQETSPKKVKKNKPLDKFKKKE